MSTTNEVEIDRKPKFDSPQQEAFLALWRTYDCLKAEEDAVFGEFAISSQQYNVLRLLKAAAPGAMAVSALGQRMITRAPDMTRMLDRLEQRDLIARERRDENRRVVEVSITEAGKSLLRQIANPLKACHQRQLGHLSEVQLQQLIALLHAARLPHENTV